MSHVLALCGGVGGAKVACGLTRALAPDELTIVVNTGDDFEHMGLHVSPDIDTVAYTLSGLADRERGWGVTGETWNFMDAVRAMGGEDWFQLGDRDLAMHVERTRRLRAGETLSRVTRELTGAFGIGHLVAPMSEDPVRTMVDTAIGELPFQRYFVAERCSPPVRSIRFEGAEKARMSPGFRAALERPDLSAVIVCPSNPYLSVDPILAVPGVRTALEHLSAPIVAVSPIIGGQALKGPAAKIMRELGAEPSVGVVARHYDCLLDALVIDTADASAMVELKSLGIEPLATAAIMKTDEDRVRLASEVLALAARLREPAEAH